MPSGAKKRKAAKKKKEKEANTNPSTNNPEGNDDAKSQDDKGSDGGEVGSPAHQDHHNNHEPFNEGSEELGERDPSSVRAIVVEGKSMEKVASGVENLQEVGSKDDGGVTIEMDMKIEGDSESKNVSVEYVESTKESYNGNDSSSSSSSSSSSDDESRNVAMKHNMEANHSVSEATSYHDLVKPVDPSSAEVSKNTEIAPAGKTSDAIAEMSPAFNPVKPVEKVENKVLLEENGKASSCVLESASKQNDDEVLPPSGGHVAQSIDGTKHIKDTEIPEYSENQPLVAPATRVVQRTSCLSCCGIFDVITGSSR